MKSIRVDIAGGAQRIWVGADADGVSLWNGLGATGEGLDIS